MTRLALLGRGRLGRAIADLAAERGCVVVATFGADGDAAGRPPSRDALAGVDVAIDVSVPGAAPANVRACLAAGIPVVVGTTGWLGELPTLEAEVRAAEGAMLHAPNFSAGVVLFTDLVAEAGRRLRALPGAGIALVETHHAAKVDAPSGTALALQRAAEGALGAPVPVTSVRVGHVPGTHELVVDAPFEQVRLVHEARDRRAFADGALAAARWLDARWREGRRGVFTMRHVLGLDPVPT